MYIRDLLELMTEEQVSCFKENIEEYIDLEDYYLDEDELDENEILNIWLEEIHITDNVIIAYYDSFYAIIKNNKVIHKEPGYTLGYDKYYFGINENYPLIFIHAIGNMEDEEYLYDYNKEDFVRFNMINKGDY